MSISPAISIITPVWNGLPYIRECVASVMSQEFQDWEHLIGDNGSTDGTRDFIDTLTDPRVHIFKHEKNLGISGNLNFLFSKARAPIAYILCADDFFYPGALASVMQEWRTANPNVAIMCVRQGTGGSRVVEYAYNILPKNISPANSALAFFLFGNFTGNVSNVSVRVSAFISTGGFVGHLQTAQDFEMWRQIAKQYEMNLIEGKIVYIREHSESATYHLTRNGDDYIQLITIYERLIEQLSKDFEREKLITYFNTKVCPEYYRTGIKYALSGRLVYLKTVLTAKSSILWNSWKQVIVCAPLAVAKHLREYIAVKLAKEFVRQSRFA
jgi:glycosyltransferase involved in cell wall biosynthesis